MPTASVAQPASISAAGQGLAWSSAACGAIALPALVAYNLPPSATFFNQALALFGWGVWLFLLGAVPRAGLHRGRAD